MKYSILVRGADVKYIHQSGHTKENADRIAGLLNDMLNDESIKTEFDVEAIVMTDEEARAAMKEYIKMKKYLLYTSEGYCEAPDGNSIENCQYLGRIEANSKEEAIEKFFDEKEWLYERGFDPCNVTAVQLADTE